MSIEGGCLCGAVRYVIAADDPGVVACYCTDCQRRSGSSHGLTLVTWKDGFSVSGELLAGERKIASGAAATAYSCKLCLTEIYSHNARLRDLVTVRAGTLDRSRDVVPVAHMWLRSRQSWIVPPPDVWQFDEQPDDPMIWMNILERRARPQ